MYTINDVALITGLTTRTLRSYCKTGQLSGEKIDGVWQFDEEAVDAFISDPNVRPSILAKNRAILFDFLNDTHKKTDAVCVMLDLPCAAAEAREASLYFCSEINKSSGGPLRFAFEETPSGGRGFLSGSPDVVLPMLNRYFHLH